MVQALRRPICKKLVSLDSPGVPFCSDRCRVIDLGSIID
ncbi:MAG TPA: DNA gyrase inhibitor YacG [Acidobacteriaceae bacterium]